FSADPDKYYRVRLFDELGFIRKKCPYCGSFFWTIDQARLSCPDQPCQQYEFLGNPATAQKFDYVTCWKKIERFFQKNGHESIPRYPVVCRWRPDLYFTIASIVDFQRIESGKVVFAFPANPLIIPQMCLRFSDIGNVGITGRHLTSFCMVGQQAVANPKGYWKDRCIDLDFELLNSEFGISKEEIVFKEDVWLGPGAFGYSLEYFVRGLELGNAVFTAYEGSPENYKEFDEKVIDMGAGLNRLVWLSQGTFNCYESVFPTILDKLRAKNGLNKEVDHSLDEYFKLAGSLDIDQFKGVVEDYSDLSKQLKIPEPVLRSKIRQIQGIYSIVDHTRTLLFAISDGMLPGNVGGGYNLRVILRRALDFIHELNLNVEIEELARWHAEFLKPMYPELLEHEDDVGTILDVEKKKYSNTKQRASKIVENLRKRNSKLGSDELLQLYDSEGITPEFLKASHLEITTPPDFYDKITSRHMTGPKESEIETSKQEKNHTFELRTTSPTNLIFYQIRDRFDFSARVLEIVSNDYVVLDSTAFYARAGGQEPDHGTINGLYVDDVFKIKNVVLHHVPGLSGRISVGAKAEGKVDSKRRFLIMRHHTATHIVNGSAREILGPWVWQHSAFKDENMARLDITHFAHLSRDQVLAIERLANEVVERNLPIVIKWMPRSVAEKEYGFRLYQGGAAPVGQLRVVNIEDWDIEACGGTHCTRTGDVGLIKIMKSERVQDGVERLEYVAGDAAVNFVENNESVLMEASSMLETPVEKLTASISKVQKNEEIARRTSKQLTKKLADLMINEIPRLSLKLSSVLSYYVSPFEEGLDSEYHTIIGDRLSKSSPSLIYLSLFEENSRVRIIVFCGENAQKEGVNAGSLVRAIAKVLGGSGGGDARFAQGGAAKKPEVLPDFQAILLNQIESRS
ncbi:MAG TPA: alanine--tRNA ligase, partial [Nitrososphaerales archaeon]|nr:alanine--tRNA ligase [Nitrososphaerales archaeon]